MKILLIVIGCLIAAVVLILILAAAKPDRISIERSITIGASPSVVFAFINDFHNWPRWAPQDREDQTMKRTYSGQASGVGAICDWESKGSAGAGRMTITQSSPNEMVEVQVDFRRPFVARNINRFELRADARGTHATWSMEGSNVYVLRVISVFVSPERMMGPHFESGLANLKALAETSK